MTTTIPLCAFPASIQNRHYEITIEHGRTLGINIGPRNTNAANQVAIVTSLAAGAIPSVSVGDILELVNGVSLAGLPFTTVLERISSVGRPFTLTFVRPAQNAIEPPATWICLNCRMFNSVPARSRLVCGRCNTIHGNIVGDSAENFDVPPPSLPLERMTSVYALLSTLGIVLNAAPSDASKSEIQVK